MLRSDHVRAIEYVVHKKRNLKEIKRGKLDMDAAGFVASGYDFADDAFLGTVLGLKLQRSAALANNHIDFVDELETTTYDTTLLITTAGTMTATTKLYAEVGACTVFADAGGELVKASGFANKGNNGTFLTGVGNDDQVILNALPGESTAIVDEGANTGAVFI